MVERIALPPAARLLTRTALVLVIMTVLGPVAGKIRMAQLLVLTVLLAVLLFFLGDALARVGGIRLVAAAGGLAAAIVIYVLAGALGTRLSVTAAVFLGIAVGLAEYLQRRWETAEA